jgi:hypothetical protein
MVKKNYKRPFTFCCITDNASGIRPEINVYDITALSHFRGSSQSMFTIEKISSFKKGFLDSDGPYVLLDLDILIHGDITEYIDSCFTEVRLIYNYWSSQDAIITNYGHNYCAINSSFVTWKGDQANHIFEFYKNNMNKISRIYWSFDQSLYYLQEEKYSYHPKGIVYTYNWGASWKDDLDVGKYRNEYKICLFNNSHGAGLDLDQVRGWARELWISYDRI